MPVSKLALGFAVAILFAAGAVGEPAAEAVRKSSVGMPQRIDGIVLPGSELEARPLESRAVPVVVRVVATYPHGTAFRYDLELYGLDPGRYDLGDYLQRKDGSTTDDLPALALEVVSLLPAGQVLPNDLAAQRAPRLGGYRVLLTAAIVAWILGLVAIIVVRRRAKRLDQQVPERPLSLAERLSPLVAAAVDERLTPAGRAEIERLLLTYWRRRLNLGGLEPLAAVAALREHEEAGALLRQVESWLHKPEGAADVDVAAVLAPYRDLPCEPVERDDAFRARDSAIQPTGGGGRP